MLNLLFYTLARSNVYLCSTGLIECLFVETHGNFAANMLDKNVFKIWMHIFDEALRNAVTSPNIENTRLFMNVVIDKRY